MIALANEMEQDVVDFERAAAGRNAKPAGELRLTTNDAFLNWLIAPMLASFRVVYPDIRLDVVVAHEHLNLSRRDADVALRATVDPPETLVGRKIAHIGWAAYERSALRALRTMSGSGLAMGMARASPGRAVGMRTVLRRSASFAGSTAWRALRAP